MVRVQLSTPDGRTYLIPSRTFSADKPPANITGIELDLTNDEAISQSHILPVTPTKPGTGCSSELAFPSLLISVSD